MAVMNNPSDFEIARTKHWYRIPVKHAPSIVNDNQLKYLSFYHTMAFPEEKYSIRWYGEVQSISKVQRRDLLPHLPGDPKAEQEYYKIEFNRLKPLPQVIVSKRHRRIIFIPTTREKLFHNEEINHLFNQSPLEERLWKRLVKEGIPAERQYHIASPPEYRFFLDFALFCTSRNINVECDGDEYHTERDAIFLDKKRNNILESEGWSVLRFTTRQITQDLDHTVALIKKTIKRHGGLQPEEALG